MGIILLICAVILVALVIMGSLIAALVLLFKRRRRVLSILRNHLPAVGVSAFLLLALGAAAYWHAAQVERERDTIREVIFRDALARYSRLVPPRSGEQYLLYEPDGAPVSAGLVQRLRDVRPRVVTNGDPEGYVGPSYHTFMIGDIEEDGPGQASTWVNTINRGSRTRADGLTDYTLSRSGRRWVVTARKFSRL